MRYTLRPLSSSFKKGREEYPSKAKLIKLIILFNTNDNLLDKKCILLFPSDCLLVTLSSVL